MFGFIKGDGGSEDDKEGAVGKSVSEKVRSEASCSGRVEEDGLVFGNAGAARSPEIGRAASAGPSSSSGTVYIVERQARTLDNSSLRTDIEFKAKIPATSDTVTGLLKNIFRRPPVGCRPSFSRKITCGVTPYTPIGQMVAAGYYLKGRSSPFVAAESFQSFQDSQNQEKISPMSRNVAVRKGVAVRFCTGSLFRLRRPGRFFPIRSSLLGACPRPLPVYPSQRSRNSYPRRGLFLSRTSRI